ncbi:MAG: baseplate assembly protein [bacterium]
MTMTSIEEPIFFTYDPEALLDSLLSEYKALTGKDLLPGQPEYQDILRLVYRIQVLYTLGNEAAKQNLLLYARDIMLDHLGAFHDTERLSATFATTVIRFPLLNALTSPYVIDAGVRVQSADGSVIFKTLEGALIPAGELMAEIPAQCETAGTAGNGYSPGRVNGLVTPLPYVDSQNVTNVTATSGGTDKEGDSKYFERIRLAPSRYSVAGSEDSYEYWTRSVRADIIDAKTKSPSECVVNIYPLMESGLPDSGVIAEIQAALSAEKKRPMTDHVVVLTPLEIPFEMSITVKLYRSALYRSSEIEAKILSAAREYAAVLRTKLGVDIVPSQIQALVQNADAGIYSVQVSVVADGVNISDTGLIVDKNEWANCLNENISVVISGTENG